MKEKKKKKLTWLDFPPFKLELPREVGCIKQIICINKTYKQPTLWVKFDNNLSIKIQVF